MESLLRMAVSLSVLSVIGTVLLWILRVLLWILIVILLLLVIILVVPFHYKVDGRFFKPGSRTYDPDGAFDAYQEGDERLIGGKVAQVFASASWMFRLVRVKAVFQDKKLSWEAKLAGKKLAGSEEEPDETEEEPDETRETVKPEEPELPQQTESGDKHETAESPQPHETTGEAEAHEEPREDLLDQFIGSVEAVLDGFDDLPDIIEDKLEPVQEFFDDFDAFEDKDKAMAAVIRMVRRILRQLGPRRFHARVDWGTGDPYTCAQILGYTEALRAFCYPRPTSRKTFESYPDLDQKNFSGKVSMKGYFLLGGLLGPAAAALLNPHVWHLLKYVRKLRKQRKR